MATFSPTPPASGKVVGRFLVAIGDGVDADVLPDGAVPTGTITFTPTVKKVLIANGSPDPFTFELQPVSATIDASGYLTFNGQTGVWLVATNDPSTNPPDFNWTVQYNIVYSGGVIDSSKFDIKVPIALAGDATTWTDLARVSPVPSSTGSAITVGPPGPVTDLTIGTVTTGTAAATITGNAPSKQLNLVLPTGGGGGAGTVTSVNGATPDGSGNVTVTKTTLGLGNVDNTADASKSFTAAQVSDSTTVGRGVLTAATTAAARTAIGAGTSNLALGTTAGTAADATVVAANKATTDAFAATKGAASGLAPLDSGSKVPTANLPTIPYSLMPAGSTFTLIRDGGGNWPNRPTTRADVFFAWKGVLPGPDPTTVGMLENDDYVQVS